MDQEKLNKWKKWLKGNNNSNHSIANDLSAIATVRNIYSELNKMVNENKEIQKPSAFYA